jgi:hypothetical protein
MDEFDGKLYPNNRAKMPAILKGWIDRVLISGSHPAILLGLYWFLLISLHEFVLLCVMAECVFMTKVA